ncbi:MAG: NUDIX hydrolase, partial [Gammaproteobacteria bacterium]|nr:NUDIX hydrolase [Gammaproteobacteria bacterium]
HFYLASAPADHLAIHDGHESVDSIWITPADAAKGESDGTYTIIFPTLANVEMLGESESVESAMDMANNRNIVSILPWTEEREDGTYVCIPDDAGYTLYEQKFPEQV